MKFVLAQGKGSRWGCSEIPFKQLIPIGNTTVIERTLSLVPDAMPVCSGDFMSHIETPYPYISLREPTGDILSGIAEILGYFDFYEDAVFYLGDVVYGRRVLNDIEHITTRSVVMFGRNDRNQFVEKTAGEIFALKIGRDFIRTFSENCRKMNWKGNLWAYLTVHKTMLIESGDWTDDIDSEDEYRRFGKTLIGLAEAEDEVNRNKWILVKTKDETNRNKQVQ